MASEDLYSWSQTAATNATADSGINWSEGQLPGSVNDSARSMMAALAKWRDDTNGTLTTGGSANAQTVTTNTAYAVLATGLRLVVKAGFSNTAAVTLNVTPSGGVAFGAKQIKVIESNGEASPAAGQIKANAHMILEYDSTANAAAGAWILQNPAFTAAVSTISAGTSFLAGVGSPSVPSFSFSSDVDTGFFSNTANQLGITVGGTTKAIIASTSAQGPAGTADLYFIGGATGYTLAIQNTLTSGAANGAISFYDGSGDFGGGITISADANTVAYNTSSDGRLKDVVSELGAGSIDNLRPITFKWKNRPQMDPIPGFVAQEVATVAKYAVVEGDDTRPWMIDVSKLIPLMVAEIKDLRARIAILESKLST